MGQGLLRIAKRIFPSPNSMRWRLFWLLGGVSVGSIVVLTLAWLPGEINENRRFQEELERVLAQSVHDQVHRFLGHVEEDLESAALQFRVALFESDQEALRNIGQRFLQQQAAFEEIGILDPQGREVFRLSRRLAVTDRDLRDRSATLLYREGMKNGLRWGPVTITETSEPWVSVTVPLSSSPRVSGMVYGLVNLKVIWDLVAEFKLRDEGQAYIVDGDGKLIAASDPSLVLRRLSFAKRPLVKDLLSSKVGVATPTRGDYTNENGVPVTATGVYLEPPGWGVIVERPQTLLYASLQRRLWFFVSLSCFGILVSLILMHFVSRSFTGPITRLRQGVDEIAAGRLNHQVAVETSDEIGELARQFNRMAGALSASIHGMEEKIVERTREISALYLALTPLAQADSNRQLFERVLERLISVTGADAAMFRVLDPEKNMLECLTQYGFPAEYLTSIRIVNPGSATEQVLKLGEPIIAADIRTDSRIRQKRQLEFGINSCTFLPLRVKDEVRGIIHLASKTAGHFRDEKEEYLMAIARLMGIVVENWELLQSSLQQAEELKQSNRELEQFAYVASHDLQEPLRMIAGYAQLLAKRYQGQLDQTANDYIAYAVDGVKRMQRLIDDLLSYSRVGAGEKAIAPADCEMILNATLAGLGPAIQANGAIVTHDPLPAVMGDADEIVQLLQNLIANGIKYRNNRVPEIHVSCQRQGREWLFSVKDNGIGIDPQYAEKIFVIFQRLHTKQEYPGTGIGLAVCKKIIQHHGGRIWVESQIQEGATFYFTLPAMENEGIQAAV